MGGMTGLKGTDGKGMVEKARHLGAKPLSGLKTGKTLDVLKQIQPYFDLVTCKGIMGGDIAAEHGFDFDTIEVGNAKSTSSIETRLAVMKMMEKDVDLILFSGGDGTARDIYSALKDHASEDPFPEDPSQPDNSSESHSSENQIPVLGIPTGVKIQSSVFAISPIHAGQLCVSFIKNEGVAVKEGEVIDLDEENYRKGIINTKLFGYLKTPFKKDFIQNMKSGTPKNEQYLQEAIAHDMSERMDDSMIYLIGPGTTTKALTDHLKINGSLLGVDVVQGKNIISTDVNYQEIKQLIKGKRVKLIITPIGGQGFILGRGNQQFTPEILGDIDKENIFILATTQKLLTLQGRPFLIDTGDARINEKLSGYYKVITGYHQSTVYKAKA